MLITPFNLITNAAALNKRLTSLLRERTQLDTFLLRQQHSQQRYDSGRGTHSNQVMLPKLPDLISDYIVFSVLEGSDAEQGSWWRLPGPTGDDTGFDARPSVLYRMRLTIVLSALQENDAKQGSW
jgi:hypothetical protein